MKERSGSHEERSARETHAALDATFGPPLAVNDVEVMGAW
jgi:hypothetical protein